MLIIKKVCLPALILISNISSVFAQTTEQRIDSLMMLFRDNTHFNGAVLAAEDGNIIYKKAFGMADMENNIPNSTTTRFRLASLGKQFTALLIMQLVEEGKIKPDGKISDYLPEYPAKTGNKITIHQLLTHTSGIPNYHVIPDYDLNEEKEYSHEEYMNLFKDKELLFEPGQQFQYSNLGYFLLGCIAERVSGKTYDQLIEEKIFNPSGMTESNLEDVNNKFPNTATGYKNIYTGYEPAKFRHPSQVFGAGNIESTVEDFYKYDKALHDGKLLSEEYMKMINTPYMNNYGYGWNVSYYPKYENDSVLLATHDGGTYGFSAAAYRFIGDNKLIVAFSNTAPYDCYNVTRAIGRILYNREEIYPKKSLAEQFAIYADKYGVDSAVNRFNYLKKTQPEIYQLDGVEFNILGYTYMNNAKIEEAIAVFRLNVESFPEVGDPYDSLAEAYMKSGEKELAVQNYKKALELDPNNSNAKVMLEKLNR